MLSLTIEGGEIWDEEKSEFLKAKTSILQLEHSLISISKWESKWKKVFLSKTEKTQEELLDYIRCMTIGNVQDENVYNFITPKQIRDINEYIESSMSATFFSDTKREQSFNKEPITSELIYYWMIALQIPFECQKWHLNRLLTLIRVCNIKNRPPKKLSKREMQEIANRNSALNAARRQILNTKG